MPENWEDNWANAFEEGFYDNVDGAEEDGSEKKALLVETDAQGRTRVVGVAHGAEAERVIAEAQAGGVEVRQNAAQVEDLLLKEQTGATDVPPEIYELMATVMSFAQDLSDEWNTRGSETLPRAGRIATDWPQGGTSTTLEFSHEDIE